MKRIVIFALALLSLIQNLPAEIILRDEDIRPELLQLYHALQQAIDQTSRQTFDRILDKANLINQTNPTHKPFAVAFDIDNTLVLDRRLESFFTGKPFNSLSDFARPIHHSMRTLYYELKNRLNATTFFVTGRADVYLDRDTMMPSMQPTGNTLSIREETLRLLQINGFSNTNPENLFCFPRQYVTSLVSQANIDIVTNWKVNEILAGFIQQNYELLAYMDDDEVIIDKVKTLAGKIHTVKIPSIRVCPMTMTLMIR